MKCPNCKTNVELTIGRYLKSLTGKYSCPDCSIHFKLNRTWKYWAWLVVVALMSILSFIIFDFLTKDTNFSGFAKVVLTVTLLISCFYFDRKFENNMDTKTIE